MNSVRRRGPTSLILALPAAVWLLVFFAAPLAMVVVYSFGSRPPGGGIALGFSFANYSALADPVLLPIVGRTLRLATLNVVLCLAMAFPVAWHLAFWSSGYSKQILLLALIVPVWLTLLVRIYAFFAILRPGGIVPALFSAVWIDTGPGGLLFSETSTLLGLVSGYLPLMLLPLWVSFERLRNSSVMSASADLGARPAQTFGRVVLPIVAPGIWAGSALVFVPSLGAYIVPTLLGGGQSYLLGNLIADEYLTSRDPGRAFAIAVALLAVVAFAAWLASRDTGEAPSG